MDVQKYFLRSYYYYSSYAYSSSIREGITLSYIIIITIIYIYI